MLRDYRIDRVDWYGSAGLWAPPAWWAGMLDTLDRVRYYLPQEQR